MATVTFVVPGPLHGYRQTTLRSRWLPRNQKYAAFKNAVYYLAIEAGWNPNTEATKDKPVRLSVIVRWKNKTRIDWKNLYGGIEDALFKMDKYVRPGSQSDVIWDAETEEATVILEY